MRRILVADDDLHVGQAVSVWLKAHGFCLSTADGGSSGVAAPDNATLDLMIIDVLMPHMEGFETIRLFRQRAPTMPLIATSGGASSGAESAGAEFLGCPASRAAGAVQAHDCVRVIDECLSVCDAWRP